MICEPPKSWRCRINQRRARRDDRYPRNFKQLFKLFRIANSSWEKNMTADMSRQRAPTHHRLRSHRIKSSNLIVISKLKSAAEHCLAILINLFYFSFGDRVDGCSKVVTSEKSLWLLIYPSSKNGKIRSEKSFVLWTFILSRLFSRTVFIRRSFSSGLYSKQRCVWTGTKRWFSRFFLHPNVSEHLTWMGEIFHVLLIIILIAH